MPCIQLVTLNCKLQHDCNNNGDLKECLHKSMKCMMLAGISDGVLHVPKLCAHFLWIGSYIYTKSSTTKTFWLANNIKLKNPIL